MPATQYLVWRSIFSKEQNIIGDMIVMQALIIDISAQASTFHNESYVRFDVLEPVISVYAILGPLDGQ